MTSIGSCNNCGAALDPTLHLYCKNCGLLNEKMAADEGVVCDTHIENRAIGFCTVCGRAVCEECAEMAGKKFLCNEPEHKVYLEKWRLLHTFDFEYEAAMLYANLEQQNIETAVFTKLNPDASESAHRPNIVEVMVRAEDLDEAIEVVKTLGLIDMKDGE